MYTYIYMCVYITYLYNSDLNSAIMDYGHWSEPLPLLDTIMFSSLLEELFSSIADKTRTSISSWFTFSCLLFLSVAGLTLVHFWLPRSNPANLLEAMHVEYIYCICGFMYRHIHIYIYIDTYIYTYIYIHMFYLRWF